MSTETKYIIAFDESGNTGQDLLNKDQPVFVLASVLMSSESAQKHLAPLTRYGAKEVKYSKLKATRRGQQLLMEFLLSPELSSVNIMVSVYHKTYMIVGKMVDLLVENQTYRDGLDLYKDGANIGLVNLMYYGIPAAIGKGPFTKLLEFFTAMIRTGTAQAIKSFYGALGKIYDSVPEELQSLLAPLLTSRDILGEVFTESNRRTLDPALPSFFEQCSHWSQQLASPFEVLHDNSKAIAAEKQAIELMMAPLEDKVLIGYDRRKQLFPLNALGITFGESHNDPRLQIADLLAGACATWTAGHSGATGDRWFLEMLDLLRLDRFIKGFIWPSREFTPKELGTDTGYGIDAIRHMTDYIVKKATET
jgi:hypothetical protein